VIVTLVTPGGTVTVDVAGVVDENNIVEAAADPTTENPATATNAATNDARPTLMVIPNPFLRYRPRPGEGCCRSRREGIGVAEAPTGAAANEAICATRPAENTNLQGCTRPSKYRRRTFPTTPEPWHSAHDRLTVTSSPPKGVT
jgi:hypothetical protein